MVLTVKRNNKEYVYPKFTTMYIPKELKAELRELCVGKEKIPQVIRKLLDKRDWDVYNGQIIPKNVGDADGKDKSIE